MTVTAGNDPPVAVDDTLSSVVEDSGQRTIAFSALTANDSPGPPDESAQTLTITQVSNPVGGTVSILGTDVVFTPAANFNGTASFDYTVSDGALTDTGTARFTVTEVNDAPTATDSRAAAEAYEASGGSPSTRSSKASSSCLRRSLARSAA